MSGTVAPATIQSGPFAGWQIVRPPPTTAPSVPTGAPSAAPSTAASTPQTVQSGDFAGWPILGHASDKSAASVTAHGSTLTGVLRQIAQAPNRLLGDVTDLSQGAINLGIRGVNSVTGTHIPQLSGSIGTTQWQQQHGGVTAPQGEAERIAAATSNALLSLPVAAGAGSMVEAAAPTVARAVGRVAPEIAAPAARAGEVAAGAGRALAAQPIGSAVAPVAAGAAIGQGAADAVPPQYAPWVNLAGNLLGGGLVAGAQEGARALGSGAAELAGRAGIGARQAVTLPDGTVIRGTAAQIRAAAQRLYQAGGEPLRAALEQDPLQNTLNALEARLAEVRASSPQASAVDTSRLLPGWNVEEMPAQGMRPAMWRVTDAGGNSLGAGFTKEEAIAAAHQGSAPQRTNLTLQTLPQQILMAARDADHYGAIPVSAYSTEERAMLAEAGIHPYHSEEEGDIYIAEPLIKEADRRYAAGAWDKTMTNYNNEHVAAWNAANAAAEPNPLIAELQGRIAAVKQAIAARGSEYETVPGEQPTLAQAAPLPGVTAGSRAAGVVPDTAAQGAAYADLLGAQAPATANPEAIGRFFTAANEALDAQQARVESGVRQEVQKRTGALGGEQSPFALGNEMTEAVQSAKAPVTAQRQALWAAVDPQGTWALQAQQTRRTAQSILGELTAPAQGRLGSAEASLLREAAALPKIVRFQHLGQFRADTNAAIREAGAAQGWQSPAVRRLTLLKQAVDADIAVAIEGKAEAEAAAVAAGQMSPDETLFAKWGATANAWLRERQQAAAAESARGNGGEANSRNVAGGRSPAVSGMGGASISARGTLGLPSGSASLPGAIPAPTAVNFSPEFGDQYRAAIGATRAEKQRFDQGILHSIMRAGRNGEPYALARSEVPGAVVSNGADEAENVANYLNATQSAAGTRAIQDAVVARLRHAGIIDPDGMVSATKLARYLSQHADTLAHLPELRRALGDVHSAQQVLDRVVAAHRIEAKAFRDGVARRFLGQDPATAVANALSGRNSAEAFDKIIDAVHGDAEALDSLKGHVVDFLLSRFAPGGTSADAGISNAAERGVLRQGALKNWIAKNKRPLRRLFGGQGIQNFEMVSARLSQSASRASAGAAETAEHGHGMATTLAAFLGEKLGEGLGAVPLVGAIGGVVGKYALDRLSAAGMRSVKDLVHAAYLHPEVARALLTKIPANGKVSSLIAKRLGAALQRTLGASMVTGAPDESNEGNNR